MKNIPIQLSATLINKKREEELINVRKLDLEVYDREIMDAVDAFSQITNPVLSTTYNQELVEKSSNTMMYDSTDTAPYIVCIKMYIIMKTNITLEIITQWP